MNGKLFKRDCENRRGVLTFVPGRRKGGWNDDETCDLPPAEMSLMEKQVLEIILPEAPPLPFPTRPMKMAYGPDALEVLIPAEERGRILQQLYPFHSCPALDEIMYDIHQQRFFPVCEYRVIRERNRNMLVSPDYPNTGGMVVDWMDAPPR
ncbi:MAG: hypothetical protein J6S21_02505, partial [Victivallales bacterium]|nr:hypothetical protein [Victivallales bacterium]